MISMDVVADDAEDGRLEAVVEPASPKREPASPRSSSGSPVHLRDTDSPPVQLRSSFASTAPPDQFCSPPISVASSPVSSSATCSPLSSPTLSNPPTILFQPFLPTSSSSGNSSSRHLANNLPRPLPFSIDNILKPTFGQRLFLHRVAAVVAAQQQQQQKDHRQLPIKKERQQRSPHLNHNNNNQPVDLSSKPPDKGDHAADGDVPPGMVRGPNGQLWPAWVFCTRYSDRPSSGPRSRKVKKPPSERLPDDKASSAADSKRPRTAFSAEQLARLKKEFEENRYLTEERRKGLADELGLHENQIKIWFQNKRAKIKKSSGQKGELAQMLAAQGLYNHSTVSVDEDDNPLY